VKSYYLCKNVFVALFRNGGAVLLDLSADRYYTLPPTAVSALEECLIGWNASPSGGAAPRNFKGDELQELLRSLEEKHLITERPSEGKAAAGIAIELPKTSLTRSEWDEIPKFVLSDLIRVLVISACALVAIRALTISRIVSFVSRWNSRAANGLDSTQVNVRSLIARYEHWRPLVFTARDKCLFDSFVLWGFLASHGVRTHWVFGVRNAPFSAHCWLQLDSAVLNDHVNVPTNYMPIMVA
jgi:Transglutaminase-like superfamily